MSWIRQRVHAYEQMRFDQEPNRPVVPFEWGLEHIGGDPNDSDPAAFFNRFVEQTLAHSDDWFAVTAATDYVLEDDVLTFTSAIESPWPSNNRVYGQLFRAAAKGPAVVVLAQWNSRWDEQQAVCRWLQKLGITAIKISLPYHDRRAIPGHPRADHLVGTNLGLTIQANRQAVLDVRRIVRWLESQGYDRIGILGTSIGSAIGFITLCHEPALHTGAFLHVATYFADVVATGLTTKNVWQGFEGALTLDQVRSYWSPISPFPYISKLDGSGKKILAISGRYDPTFQPQHTQAFLKAIRRDGVTCETMSLPCGHYSLGNAPFKYAAGYRFGTFLRRMLT
jgi:dienelactone hydrolase